MASERARRRKADDVPTDPPGDVIEAVAGHPDRTRTMRAAGTRIRYGPNGMRPKGAAARQPWQALAWGYFDDVPEIKAGVYLLGNIMSKIRWFVAVHPNDDPTAEPIAVTDPSSGIAAPVAERAAAELHRLRAEIGGQGEIVRAMNMNLEVAAEAFVVGYGAREGIPDPLNPAQTIGASPERWELRSVLEIDVRADGTYIVDGTAASGGVRLDLGTDDEPGIDTCIRIFQRHPAWLNRSDCAMRGLLLDCETVITLTNEAIADSRSRHSAGVLLVSEKLTKYHDKLAARDHSGDEAKASEFLDDLDAALTDPVDDPGTAAAAAPTVVTFPADDKAGDVMAHLRFGADSKDRDLEAKITARAERIGRGMNLPPEKIMGHMKTTFANAGQIARDQFSEYIEPRCVLVADGLTGTFLRPNLTTPTIEADGVMVSANDAARMFVWFDAGQVIGEADLSSSALAAHGAGLINDGTAREALGYPDTAAPKPGEQLATQALSRGTISDVMMLAVLGKMLGIDLGIDPASLVPPPAAPPAIAASARQRSRLGDRLTGIDRDLRTRLLGAADRSMARVMEKAGNRLANRAEFRPLVTDVPKARVAAHLGRSVVVAAGFDDADLVGRFDDLHDLFVQWASTAGDQAVDELAQAIGGFDVAARDALGLRQAASIEEAWAWFERSMIDLAAAKLYDPTAGIEALGEATDLAVPAGLVREALARAGGVTALGTDGGSAWVAVPTDGSAPGGVATGPIAMGAWGAAGGQVDGYVWDYGPAARSRPFEPHRELDGLTFVNFDDPALANMAGFPDTDYFIPGDHTGCVCDVSPIMIAPEEASA